LKPDGMKRRADGSSPNPTARDTAILNNSQTWTPRGWCRLVHRTPRGSEGGWAPRGEKKHTRRACIFVRRGRCNGWAAGGVGAPLGRGELVRGGGAPAGRGGGREDGGSSAESRSERRYVGRRVERWENTLCEWYG